MKKENLFKILTALLFVQIGLVALFSKFPNQIENLYANGFYAYWSIFLRKLFGWIPFSIGDILYISVIIFIIRYLYLLIKSKRRNYKMLFFQVFGFFSIVYFLFYFFWGLNYSRIPLANKLALQLEPYQIEKLNIIADKLIVKVNQTHIQLVSNDTLKVDNPNTKNEILQKTVVGYKNLEKILPEYRYHPPSIKNSLWSLALTYMGFTGYLNPFTGEAQVNYLAPKYALPMTSSHEVAHQLGIASESEANFIGYLAATHHDDLYFQYAGYLAALRYVLLDIYRSDKDLYQLYIKKLNKGVLKNIKESRDFWASYENPAEPLFKLFYDNFLKYNQQKDGLESYNQMVALLVAYDKKHPL